MKMNRLAKLYVDNRKAKARQFSVVAKAESKDVEIFLYDHIVSSEEEAEWWGGIAPESFVKAVREVDPTATIHLRVNCPGGSVFAARAMEQALRDHKGTVIGYVDGIAASAATFILAGGCGKVVMGSGSMFMIHKAWTYSWGNANDLRKEADLLDKIDGTLAQTYSTKTGIELGAINDWMAAETWFTASEAKEHGFADEVSESSAKAAADWDLSAYDNAPKPEAKALAPEAEPAPEPSTPEPDNHITDDHRARQVQRLNLISRI